MANKDLLGRRGEELAARRLEALGFTVLERNWRCPIGEVDIVARERGVVVFVEVKTRTSAAFGHPFEAITAAKRARLRRLAAAWCEAHPTSTQAVRIDAVAVLCPPAGAPVIEHLRAVC